MLRVVKFLLQNIYMVSVKVHEEIMNYLILSNICIIILHVFSFILANSRM